MNQSANQWNHPGTSSSALPASAASSWTCGPVCVWVAGVMVKVMLVMDGVTVTGHMSVPVHVHVCVCVYGQWEKAVIGRRLSHLLRGVSALLGELRPPCLTPPSPPLFNMQDL